MSRSASIAPGGQTRGPANRPSSYPLDGNSSPGNTAINPPLVNPWIIAVAVMISTFMEVLDTTVVNVSLPHIAGSLSATVDESTWALTSYLVANAIILPMTGWLANHFGRKRLLMASVTGFTAASFFCGLAPNLPVLIIFRVIQGACGGGLQPLSQALLLEAFKPEDRGKAMGFWGLGIVFAPMLGPVIGGWLTDSYSWRWVFYINIPVGVMSIIMTRLFILRTYSTCVLLMTVVGFVLYGSLVLVPIFLQTMLGYPALQAGFAMAPRGLGSFLAMPFVGAIMAKFDPRKLLALGVVFAS